MSTLEQAELHLKSYGAIRPRNPLRRQVLAALSLAKKLELTRLVRVVSTGTSPSSPPPPSKGGASKSVLDHDFVKQRFLPVLDDDTKEVLASVDVSML